MDEPNLNEKAITKDNFSEVASEKISRILSFPGNDCLRSWAVKFLRKAAWGFSACDHHPWIESLSTVESSEIILSNCGRALRNVELASPSLTSALSFVVNHPLQFNPFIAALACLLTNQIEESQQSLCIFPKQDSELCSGLNTLKTNVQTCEVSSGPSLGRNVGIAGQKRLAENDDCNLLRKKRRPSESLNKCLTRGESLNILKQIWTWAKAGHVQLDVVIVGDILSYLPDCIEEIVISWIREELSSRRSNIGDISSRLSPENAEVEDENPCEDDMLHSLSILHESPILMAAAASSPKLFQQISSILNQFLIQASECSCNFAPLLSLSKAFAQEAAKGRAEFYPLQVQPIILLLNEDPNNEGRREFISSQITSMFKSLPTEVMIAVLSHFPDWMPFLNYIALL